MMLWHWTSSTSKRRLQIKAEDSSLAGMCPEPSEGWRWSVPFPLQLFPADEQLHVKSCHPSQVELPSTANASPPLEFTIRQEVLPSPRHGVSCPRAPSSPTSFIPFSASLP